MSFWGVVIGSVCQAMLALFLFMLGAFAGAGLVNGRAKGMRKKNLSILNLSIYLLPLSCVISGGIVVYGYLNGVQSSNFYWWYALPVVLTVFYMMFIKRV